MGKTCQCSFTKQNKYNTVRSGLWDQLETLGKPDGEWHSIRSTTQYHRKGISITEKVGLLQRGGHYPGEGATALGCYCRRAWQLKQCNYKESLRHALYPVAAAVSALASETYLGVSSCVVFLLCDWRATPLIWVPFILSHTDKDKIISAWLGWEKPSRLLQQLLDPT